MYFYGYEFSTSFLQLTQTGLSLSTPRGTIKAVMSNWAMVVNSQCLQRERWLQGESLDLAMENDKEKEWKTGDRRDKKENKTDN